MKVFSDFKILSTLSTIELRCVQLKRENARLEGQILKAKSKKWDLLLQAVSPQEAYNLGFIHALEQVRDRLHSIALESRTKKKVKK